MVIRSHPLALASAALLLGTVVTAAHRGEAAPAAATAELTLEPQGAAKTVASYYPTVVKLSAEKPAGITKEPAYTATPRYGTIKLGTDKPLLVAVDEPKDAEWKLYVDANRNGDLTDDGNGAWSGKREAKERTMYGLNRTIIDTSWTLADGKQSTGKYGLAFYRFSNQDYLLMYREGARLGTLAVDGKPHKVALVENDADGLYAKSVTTVEEAKKGRPVWLLIDLNDDGKFNPQESELFDVRAPFKIGATTYEVTLPADGSTITLAPTTKVALDLVPKPTPRPALLEAGTPAPDFTAEAWGGGNLNLAKYKGQVVILDFWATWCGPCQRSMPHVEKVYQAVKDQKVAVLAVCVWDDKDAYTKWMPENKDKYHFQFAFDPAGKEDNSKSIASKHFKVSGIPTTYIIDKEGKVAASIVGYQDGDKRIEEALQKLGIKLNELASAK